MVRRTHARRCAPIPASESPLTLRLFIFPRAGDNLYSSTRCQWYTGVSDSTTASCPFPSCTQFLVFEDDSDATVQACVNELNTECGDGSQYGSVCSKCSDGFSCACQEEFQDMYMHGECGTFSEIPNYASCRV